MAPLFGGSNPLARPHPHARESAVQHTGNGSDPNLTASASTLAPTADAQSRGSYWITTFGCQMNKADSERMAGILEAMGYKAADAELEADLVLYNLSLIHI